MPLLVKPAMGRVTQFYVDANAAEHTGRTAHYGVDFGWYDYAARRRDTRVFAAASGILNIQPVHEGYGVNCLVEHGILGTPTSRVGFEPKTFYAHLLSVDASLNGRQVQQGQQIATMGSSGNYAKGQTHLHFELRARMLPTTSIVKLDPTPYFGSLASGGVVVLEEERELESDMKLLYREDINQFLLVGFLGAQSYFANEGLTMAKSMPYTRVDQATWDTEVREAAKRRIAVLGA